MLHLKCATSEEEEIAFVEMKNLDGEMNLKSHNAVPSLRMFRDANSALKSGPVSVLLPFLEGPRTGPVPESFRMQKPWTGTAKNRKKLVKTGCNWSQNEYNKTRAISVKIGHKL